MAADFNAGITHNIATGRRNAYSTVDGKTGNDHYSLVSGNRKTSDNFTIFKLGGSYSVSLPDNWMARLAGGYQSSFGLPLPPSEQLGLVGAQAVRGFHERVVASDAGYMTNVELYTPDIAPLLTLPGNLRPLFFVDAARGYNYRSSKGGNRTGTEPSGVMSAGIGLRYNYKKIFNCVSMSPTSLMPARPRA